MESGETRCTIDCEYDDYGKCVHAECRVHGDPRDCPAAIPESAIEPEPRHEGQCDYDIDGICIYCDAKKPAASSAIEVAPEKEMKEFLAPCDDKNCSHPYCWSQRPSVAPGEAQREPTPSICTRHGRMAIDCRECFPSHAVPSEVAPSREQRLEDALRDVREYIKNDATEIAYVLLDKIDALLEAK